MKYMLVASPDKDACYSLSKCFDGGYRIDIVDSGRLCLEAFQKKQFEFVFIDTAFLVELGAADDIQHYHNTLKLFWNIAPSIQIIVLCDQAGIRRAVTAVQAGANNYLTCPIDIKEARYVVQTTYDALRMQLELDYLRDKFWQTDSLDFVRTSSALMKDVFVKIRTVAPADTNVLITGKTGTGKGIIANLIHRHSARKGKQFISVHCGAIPDNLLESELFGHERGSFTGAVRRKLGKFEIAHGGTIFLDEIGTMPLGAQVKLLQVLQERIFNRVGGEDAITCDVRVIAASNIKLEDLCEKELFRRDLYYRLNVFPIELPSLRERREDIPLFAEYFLRKLNKSHVKKITGIHPDVMEALLNYSWPGNIRELENLIERGFLLETSKTLLPHSFPGEIFGDINAPVKIDTPASMSLAETRKKCIDEVEKAYLIKQLSLNKGRIAPSAKAAGITPRQLHKLCSKYGIHKESFK